MSNYNEQLDFASGAIISRLKGLAANPPETDTESGLDYYDMTSAKRYNSFSTLITEDVSTTLVHAAREFPEDMFDVLAWVSHAGIDTSVHFIRTGSNTIMESELDITIEQTCSGLIDSTDVLEALMRSKSGVALSTERAYGLGSVVSEYDDSERFMVVAKPVLRLALQDLSLAYLKSAPGRCPFINFMPAVFKEMVGTAAKIDWLIPLDFERMAIQA